MNTYENILINEKQFISPWLSWRLDSPQPDPKLNTFLFQPEQLCLCLFFISDLCVRIHFTSETIVLMLIASPTAACLY